MTAPAPSPTLTQFPVVMEVPPDVSYLTLMRSAAAAAAARLDFTIDAIEDLKIAVSEACALLLADVDTAHPLRCALRTTEDSVEMVASVHSHATQVDMSSFGWMVLEALAGQVDATVENGVLTITIVKRKGSDFV